MRNRLTELSIGLDKLCRSLEWQLNSMDSIGECANRREVIARDLSQTAKGFKRVRTIAKQVLKNKEYDLALNIRQTHLLSMIQLLHTLDEAVGLLGSKGGCSELHSNWTLDMVKDVYVGMRYGVQELFKTIVTKL